jgi:hypothetical protein
VIVTADDFADAEFSVDALVALRAIDTGAATLPLTAAAAALV